MLDQETKNNIDSARQILVGKVPDPKSQIEQITIALIYKFMDDMDRENQDAGFKKQYFVRDWSKYAWTKLLDQRLSNDDRLDLYIQAISNMPKNPHIPQLFCDIFKDAFLPYKDSRTLSLFLKEINKFTYDNSENLGNAFEYLLSIMGSQGDAGQFRTPRHIIDFIVEVVDPKKNERVLDPACGTAGFLISAYKYIVKQSKEKRLTLDEKNRLMSNIIGYDISPDMVRLALVNLYLHGFSEPKIYEYDTLTSEKRWDKNFNVILANPPFMSPKGGIQPHNKFSVQANRSEVLFVDYIAEHLTLKGRAGIIVPEGIIFQSGNAYKELRKLLVDENYLYAVVSLPGGVFQPYSGVKTSILFLDRQIAKQKKNILFVRIDNDGFDLGAQRRPISANDLPEALKIINDWKADKNVSKNNRVIVADKNKIAENGDYNLSAERYRIIKKRKNQKWEMVKLGDVCDTIVPPKKIQTSEFLNKGKYPIIDQSQKNISGYSNDNDAVINITTPVVIFGDHTCVIKYADMPFVQGADGIKVLKTNDRLLPKFLYYCLKNNPVKSEGYNRHFTKLKQIQIPLPPLDVQERIVAEIETYQKIIDGARQVIENWKPNIKVDEKWEMVKLGDVCERIANTVLPETINGNINYIGLENIETDTGELIGSILTLAKTIKSAKNKFEPNHVLYGKLRPNLNKVLLSTISGICSTDIFVIKTKESILPKYLTMVMRGKEFNKLVLNGLKGSQLPRVDFNYMQTIQIPLPPLDVQERIVAEIEEENQIIKSNKRLIELMEKKIAEVIAMVYQE
jgi:type I restriction enzyme M protein